MLITGNISFKSNSATFKGGAMGLEDSCQLQLLRSPLVASFYDNEADYFGGAICNAYDDSESCLVCS